MLLLDIWTAEHDTYTGTHIRVKKTSDLVSQVVAWHRYNNQWWSTAIDLSIHPVGYAQSFWTDLDPVRQAVGISLTSPLSVTVTYTSRWTIVANIPYVYTGVSPTTQPSYSLSADVIAQPGCMGQIFPAILEGGGTGLWNLLRPVTVPPSNHIMLCSTNGYSFSTYPMIQFSA